MSLHRTWRVLALGNGDNDETPKAWKGGNDGPEKVSGSSVSLTQHRQGEDWVQGLSASICGSRPTSPSLMLAETDGGAGTWEQISTWYCSIPTKNLLGPTNTVRQPYS